LEEKEIKFGSLPEQPPQEGGRNGRESWNFDDVVGLIEKGAKSW